MAQAHLQEDALPVPQQGVGWVVEGGDVFYYAPSKRQGGQEHRDSGQEHRDMRKRHSLNKSRIIRQLHPQNLLFNVNFTVF